MTLSEYVNKNGVIAGLRAIGKNVLANKLANDKKQKAAILKKEGVIPYKNRPAKTREKLTGIHERKMEADKILWDNRKRTVSP